MGRAARIAPAAARGAGATPTTTTWRAHNALEDNVVAYKVVAGRRTDLTPVGSPRGTYGVKVPVASAAWHTLRVDFAGSEFTVTYDGRRLFAVRDDTFPDAGAVGIWSKADSVTEFDTFSYKGAP